jgi:hydrogenase maturation factor
MRVIDRRIWEFDVDDTLIMWDKSKFPKPARIVSIMTKKGLADVIINQKNVNLLIKLAKLGYYIRVHSGSGAKWARDVVNVLRIQDYVDSVESKPVGKTDDRPPGDGITYLAYRDAITGGERNDK